MLNKYPLWKYILILAVLAIGSIYSAPNLYPDDPAIQVSGASTALQVNQADLDRVSKALDARLKVYEGDVKSLLRKERVRYRSLPQLGGAIQLGFSDDASREEARALVRKNFKDFDIVPADLNGQPVLRLAMTPAKLAE